MASADYTYKITVEDVAGHTTDIVSNGSLTVDTQAPSTTGIDDFETSDTTPMFSGHIDSLEEGATVSISVAGDTYTGEVDADGEWSIEATQEINVGQHSYDVTVVDVAGNSITEEHTLTII